MKIKSAVCAAILGLSLSSGVSLAADSQDGSSSDAAKPIFNAMTITDQQDEPMANYSGFVFSMEMALSLCRTSAAKDWYGSLTECMEHLSPAP